MTVRGVLWVVLEHEGGTKYLFSPLHDYPAPYMVVVGYASSTERVTLPLWRNRK